MGTSQVTVITKPTLEPVTLADAKRVLRVNHTDDDLMIQGHIKSAREFAEKFCNIYVMTTIIERQFDDWPSQTIEFKDRPIQSIDSIKYDDTASPTTEQTLVVNTDYYADIVGGRVTTIGGWPSVSNKPLPIRIRMTVGYTNRNNVPNQIQEGIKAYVVYLYDGQESMLDTARNILWSERRM